MGPLFESFVGVGVVIGAYLAAQALHRRDHHDQRQDGDHEVLVRQPEDGIRQPCRQQGRTDSAGQADVGDDLRNISLRLLAGTLLLGALLYPLPAAVLAGLYARHGGWTASEVLLWTSGASLASFALFIVLTRESAPSPS